MDKLPQIFAGLLSAMLLPAFTFAGGAGATPVQVATAVEIELSPMNWNPGTVISRYDAKLAAEVAGRIISLVEIGDEIDKRDKLVQLDGVRLNIQIEEMDADVMSAKAKLEFFIREAERLEILAKKNNAAQNRFEEIVSERDQMNGELNMKKARLADVQDQHDRTILYAPFQGVVTERYKEKGEWVDVGEEILRIVDPNIREITVRIRHQAISLIKKGGRLQVKDDQYNGLATVKTLVPVGGDISRLYEMRLSFDQGSPDLWAPGHSVQVAVPVAMARKVIAVPRDALVIRSDSIKVFRILDSNIAEAVNVTTGIADADLIEVTGNINAGDQIVIRGNERLRPQQPVIIQPRQ